MPALWRSNLGFSQVLRRLRDASPLAVPLLRERKRIAAMNSIAGPAGTLRTRIGALAQLPIVLVITARPDQPSLGFAILRHGPVSGRARSQMGDCE